MKNKGVVRCNRCGQYVPLDQYPHNCGTPLPKQETDWTKKTHAEVVDYYMENPDEIEKGFQPLGKEKWITRGRADLIGKDNKGRLCIVEIWHLTKRDNNYWASRLRKYRRELQVLGRTFFQVSTVKVRLLLKHSGMPTQEIDPLNMPESEML